MKDLKNLKGKKREGRTAACVLSDGGPSTLSTSSIQAGSGWLKSQWFLVDKLVAGGLDDWEVKIADFVVLLGKDAKKVSDAANRAKSLWETRLRCRNWGLTPLIILAGNMVGGKRERKMNNEKNVPGQKATSRISRLAIASCCLALLPWPFGLGLCVIPLPEPVAVFMLMSCPLSVLIGISALVLIRYKRPRLRGKMLAIAGIAISIASIAFYLFYVNQLNRLIYVP